MPGRHPCRSHAQADFWNPTGHPTCPAANRDSTRTGSASTVTNGASVHQHGPPAMVHHDMRREGRCHVRRQDSSDTGTVTTPTTTDTNTNTMNPSSATDLTSPGPVVDIRNDGQQGSAGSRCATGGRGRSTTAVVV